MSIHWQSPKAAACVWPDYKWSWIQSRQGDRKWLLRGGSLEIWELLHVWSDLINPFYIWGPNTRLIYFTHSTYLMPSHNVQWNAIISVPIRSKVKIIEIKCTMKNTIGSECKYCIRQIRPSDMVWIHPAFIFKSISAWNVDAEHDDVDENTVNVVEDCAWHNAGF